MAVDRPGARAVDAALAECRPRLLGLAYRMLGTLSDAEDVVQDAVVRARAGAPDDLREPVAFLTTATTRAAIDHLRSARVRREAYVGTWLPEPVPGDPAVLGAGAPAGDVADAAELADSLSLAFLVALEALSPEERAVLLLHEVFGAPHREVADVLGRSEGACRQLLRRARRHLADARPRRPVDPAAHRRLVDAFVAACEVGDLAGLTAVLAADVRYEADGGAEVRAARRPIVGRDRVARFLAWWRGRDPARRLIPIEVNGDVALAVVAGRRLDSVVVLEGDASGRVAVVRAVRNPHKLVHVRAVVEGTGSPDPSG